MNLYEIEYLDPRTKTKKLKTRVPALSAEQATNGLPSLERKLITTTKEITGFDKWLTLATSPALKSPADLYITLAPMLAVGVPIVDALYLLVRSLKSIKQKEQVMEIVNAIQGGSSVPNAFNLQSIFPKGDRALILAGDRTGKLDSIFTQLEEQERRADAISRKIKGALAYPMAVAIATYGLIILFTFVLMPKLVEIYAGLGAQLPWATRQVLVISNLFTAMPWTMGIVPILVFLLFHFRGRLSKTVIIKWLSLHLPVVKGFLLKYAMAKAIRTLTLTERSGVPLMEGLVLAAESTGLAYYEETFMAIRAMIASGKSVSESFRLYSYALGKEGDRLCTTIEVGEKIGNLAYTLEKLANIYETELNSAVEGLQKAIEPIVIVLLAVVVGFLIFAMYYPIFTLGQHFMEDSPTAPPGIST